MTGKAINGPLPEINLTNVTNVTITDVSAGESAGRRFKVGNLAGDRDKKVIFHALFKQAQALAHDAKSTEELHAVREFIRKLRTAEENAQISYEARDDSWYKFRSFWHRLFGGAFFGTHLDRLNELNAICIRKEKKLLNKQEQEGKSVALGYCAITEESLDANLTSLNLECVQFGSLQPEKLEELSSLTYLKVMCCDDFTDDILQHIAKLDNLTSLVIEVESNITNEGIKHLAKLKNLTSLSLIACKNITDECLEELKQIPNLSSLSIGGCQSITDEGLKVIATIENLTSLDVSGCQGITDEGLKVIATMENLTALNVQGCKNLTNEGLKSITQLTHLTSLNLSECIQLTNASLREVLPRVTALVNLDLSSNPEVTDKLINDLQQLPNLTSINLQGCSSLTSQGLASLGQIPHLVSIDLSFCDVRDETLAAFEALNLTSLTLSRCQQITVKGFETIGKMTQLTSLNFGGCKQIEDAHVGKLHKLHYLTDLDLSSTSITKKGIDEVMNLPYLAVLRLDFCGLSSEYLKKLQKRKLTIKTEAGLHLF